jgi:hypothetical protein
MSNLRIAVVAMALVAGCVRADNAGNTGSSSTATSDRVVRVAELGGAMAVALRELPNACPAALRLAWGPKQDYTIEAMAVGPNCVDAVATVVMRRANGDVLAHESLQVAFVQPLTDAKTPEELQAAMRPWLEQDAEGLSSTAKLAEWTSGDGPAGEFPFYFEEGSKLTKAEWENLRRRDLPIVSFAQGMESLAVYVLEDGALTKLGVQSFPG